MRCCVVRAQVGALGPTRGAPKSEPETRGVCIQQRWGGVSCRRTAPLHGALQKAMAVGSARSHSASFLSSCSSLRLSAKEQKNKPPSGVEWNGVHGARPLCQRRGAEGSLLPFPWPSPRASPSPRPSRAPRSPPAPPPAADRQPQPGARGLLVRPQLRLPRAPPPPS